MNERIKELHGQAYLYALHNETKAREDGIHEPGTFDNDYREKFAELIVRKCADYIDTFNKENMVEEGIGGTELKQHFGVNE